ncbi:Retrovirus-related Pol polyprotein, partial [Mucuna pruriens]
MEDEKSGKGSTLIHRRPFLMTTQTKIDVHVGMLSMEFGDNLVQFNIFEAMKHPTKDHSLFGIDIINELVVEHLKLEASSAEFPNFVEDINVISYLRSVIDESDYDRLWEVQDLSNLEDDDIYDLSHLNLNSKLVDLIDEVYKYDEELECSKSKEVEVAETKKPLQVHEEKLLHVLRQHKKAIRWKLSNLPGINPSIYMLRILIEAKTRPIRQQQRRLSLTILDVVKKEVTKLLAVGIIHPILDSQWVSPMQVVPKKFGMIVMKNQHNELVPMRIQNNWCVCIDYRKLNQATHKDYFPLPFIDQILEKLAGKSHYCFLDGLYGYMQIHIAPEDQHKTTFTCPFGTFAYTRMLFGLCNTPSTLQRYMTSIFSNLLQDCMEVFMDDFMMYAESFDACLENLSRGLTRCIDTNLVLNFEKCHFMVIEGIVLGHLVSSRGIEVDKSKINIITSLPNPAFVQRFTHSLYMQGSIEGLSRISARFPYRCLNCYKRMWISILTSLVLKPSKS